MKWSILIFLNIGFFLFTSRLKALEGIKNFEQHIYEKNQEILSLQNNIEAKEALSSSSNSIYYPTLNAVGGFGDYRTDEFSTQEKGYLGYVEGRVNLFKGFKDQAVSGQREIDFEYSKLELESKKRDLKRQLTEIFSDMIFLHKLQNILEEEYNVTQTQRKMAAKKVSAGLTGSVDNLEFDLRESEIQIEQKQLSQKHQETHQRFIKMYGEDILDKDLESIDFSQVELLLKTPDKIKIQNTIDYQKAVLVQKRFDLERKEIRSDYLPSLDFTYAAGRLTPS
ncbi:MAG: TolC family protein, partial [Bdellovibrionaceae bacterium]|nr:TolC family protein [Pseudobdellovibrionaceae bacterium]